MITTIRIKIEDLTLDWIVSKDSASQQWAEGIKQSISKSLPDRLHFSNFQEPAEHHSKINSYMLELKENISDMPDIVSLENVDIAYLNNLHAWFAKNETTNQLLAEMHHNLHALEGQLTIPTKFLAPAIQVSWSNTPRYEFKLEEYNNFTNVATFGDLLLTYCHIGKEPVAMFRSNDNLSNDVFVPYTHYSADFFMWFGDSAVYETDIKFWKWFDDNYRWFKERTGWTPRDPRIVTGRYVVARLVTDISKESIIKHINVNSKIQEIIIE